MKSIYHQGLSVKQITRNFFDKWGSDFKAIGFPCLLLNIVDTPYHFQKAIHEWMNDKDKEQFMNK